MPETIRKLTVGTHVVTSVGWFGALLVFLAHAVAAQTSSDEQLVRSLAVAMGLATWFVILPLSIASIVSGVLAAVSSSWGLLRHYWVAFKLLLTVVATGVLLLKLQPIDAFAMAGRCRTSAQPSSPGYARRC